ncbi:hypothetical protein [Georgenia sp. SYP-B2076]|uniref:hypothetical protein n=1 Tax=Georgenia sp. SYP-B2076 TaxID=2495881 RepID=UPI000F8E58F4|nr:hypothetical protein [Georgenia sp. SYP-B2076]
MRPPSSPPPAGGPSRRRGLDVLAALGLLLLVVVLPVYVVSGLLAPTWAVVVLLLVWLGLLALGVRWFRAHPGRVLALPVAAAAVWLAAMYLGDVLLGWTA